MPGLSISVEVLDRYLTTRLILILYPATLEDVINHGVTVLKISEAGTGCNPWGHSGYHSYALLI
ncbi:hypothetical protein SAMN05216516_102293 [Izhakiella capsodis]|uniref:Uncharacterized protein n=1 Tax=Izhakiella capsodis TaxID=1367852 RepID=A0A1I4W4W2_9GAMM|nr:hypothetical protein [Izhakiella capsodis]SFN08591.1 hypothetical protein SAMN05216516_102293 [Izhakiella capsodis]